MKHHSQHHSQHQSQYQFTDGRSGVLHPTPILLAMGNTTKTNTISTTTNTMALQRSATTMTQDDLRSHTALRSRTRRPESLCEVKRKSDPVQDVNKSLFNLLSPVESFLGKFGSGRFAQGYSPASKKGQGGHSTPPAFKKGQGGHSVTQVAAKKGHSDDKSSDAGRYEKKAAATFYELTESKGEAVGEVGLVEGQGAALSPPSASSFSSSSFVRDKKSDAGKGKHGFLRGVRKRGSIKGKDALQEVQKGTGKATEPQKPSTKATEPQKPTTGAEKGAGTQTTSTSGVPQGGKVDPARTRGTPAATEAQKGRRKASRDTTEAKKHDTSGREARKSARKSTRRKVFQSGTKCAGHEDETTTEEEVDGGGGGSVGGADKNWAQHDSFRGGFGGAAGGLSSASGDPSHSDTELGKISAPHSLLDGECGSVGQGSVGDGSLASDRGMDMGRVSAWATSFEKLLEDPAGLHTFAEFLKKEYSHENIYFWTACERYKRLTTQEELQTVAREIFERHLYSGAPEPVNVDSQARQDAQDGLHLPNEALFAQAQKQIFNLMKFDSYSRFLKSGLYTDCLNKERRGQPLPYPGDHTLDPDLRIAVDDPHVKLKKSRSDADERRRKSLLPPWSRKDRSKSKDRGEAEYRRRRKHHQHQQHQHQQHQRLTSDSSSIRSISGSQTSLNSSSDMPLGRRAASRESLTSAGDQGSISGGEGGGSGVGGGSSSRSRSSSNTITCRVFLPDSSKSVVLLRPSETIQEVMMRLVERRGLLYTYFDVYLVSSNKMLCREDDAMTLKDKKVRLEPRVLFQLVLMGQKAIFLKADPSKAIGEKLKPLLSKAGLKMDLLHIHKEGEEKTLNLKAPIGDLDGATVIVQTKEDVREWGVEGSRQKRRGGSTNATNGTNAGTNSLHEITNRVFQDLRNGKMEQFEEVVDLDAGSSRTDSSDKSSGIHGEFSRRNSFGLEKEHSSSSGSHLRMFGKSRAADLDRLRTLHPQSDHPLITKRRGNTTTTTSNTSNGGAGGVGGVTNADNDNELYEGLKRAQRSRLDDQRGTEINFELPEFLKNDKKQDAPNTDN